MSGKDCYPPGYRPFLKNYMAYTRPTNLTLGCVAKDSITGFQGVVIAVTEWLNGCQRVTIQPQQLDNGKRLEADTFDAEQVVVVEAVEVPAAKQKGGPSIAPAQRKDPSRF
jgi:hypothetical protein